MRALSEFNLGLIHFQGTWEKYRFQKHHAQGSRETLEGGVAQGSLSATNQKGMQHGGFLLYRLIYSIDPLIYLERISNF